MANTILQFNKIYSLASRLGRYPSGSFGLFHNSLTRTYVKDAETAMSKPIINDDYTKTISIVYLFGVECKRKII